MLPIVHYTYFLHTFCLCDLLVAVSKFSPIIIIFNNVTKIYYFYVFTKIFCVCMCVLVIGVDIYLKYTCLILLNDEYNIYEIIPRSKPHNIIHNVFSKYIIHILYIIIYICIKVWVMNCFIRVSPIVVKFLIMWQKMLYFYIKRKHILLFRLLNVIVYSYRHIRVFSNYPYTNHNEHYLQQAQYTKIHIIKIFQCTSKSFNTLWEAKSYSSLYIIQITQNLPSITTPWIWLQKLGPGCVSYL